MIDAIKQASKIDSSLISCFQHPDNLMMLIYACRDLASVEEVMRLVNLKLPLKDEVQQAIKEAIENIPPSNIRISPIKWYATEIKMGKTSGMPVEVHLQIPNKSGLTYAQIIKRGQFAITIPPEASSIITQDMLISIDEILKQLTRIGFVLITLM